MVTIKTFLDYILGLWKERCDTLRGVSEQEITLKKRLRVIEQVKKFHGEEIGRSRITGVYLRRGGGKVM